MNGNLFWGMYLRLGFHFDAVNPTSRTGRYLGDETRVDWNRIDGRVGRMAAAGMNMLLLELGEAMEFTCLPKARLRGQVKASEVNEHIRKWRELGIETVPIVEFSAVHSEWMGEYSRMTATPPYRKKCLEILRETHETLENPRFIHIGMADETKSLNAGNLVAFRQKEVLWNELRIFSDAIVKTGARPWMWGDAVGSHLDDFAGNLPKDFLVSYRWMVNVTTGDKIPEPESKWIETFDRIDAAGYDQVPVCSTNGWYQRGRARSVETVLNPPYLAKYVRSHVSPERLKGLCCFGDYLPDETGDRVQRQTCEVFGKVKKNWDSNSGTM